ncbi:UDP-glycosyltransferase UGT4-like isoform X2 [Harmonia axyridis]|uniref:UDP-glycosyltransferase UGT4-like isoform X2 n=1 Tax=Harmonia axyridis TaxID=115357 RepID=UPI001E274E07|nr:UDP-glycosyltransferase UGT4-like isoform X2 [Harmonia axyridis]
MHLFTIQCSKMKLLPVFTLLFCAYEFTLCANILAVAPGIDINYKKLYFPLWRKLAEKGHNITLITSSPMEPHKNITQIDFSRFKLFNIHSDNNSVHPYRNPSYLEVLLITVMKEQFKDPAIRKLLKEGKFDLMFLELEFPYWSALAAKFNCPLIGLSNKDAPPIVHYYMGNAMHPALYPWDDRHVEEFNLALRTRSTIATIFIIVLTSYMSGGTGSYLMSRFVQEGLPDSVDMYGAMSLIFINANPIFHRPRPITPTTLNLGGFLSISDAQELPEDLQKYLDESKDGCIYVSFGTTVNSAYLSAEQKEVLTSVFKDMAPMRILWKFDEVDIANKPKNVEIRTWVPQQDVLRHPNVKAFITQGGLQSMEEAIDSAVPMLGMPFYGDQNNNVNKMETKKFGLKLLPTEMNKESLKAALKELLENPIYKKNIDKLSAISKDQPMKGLEKAVWWTEYVLRHGTQHLRSPSADIPLYQYYFLDVIAVVSVCAYVFYKLMKSLILTLVLILRKLYNFFIVKRKRD